MKNRYPKMVMSHREYYIRQFFKVITSKEFLNGVAEALGMFLAATMIFVLMAMVLIIFPDEPINKELNKQENQQTYPASHYPSQEPFKTQN
ncbi:hypothetical protein PERMA_A0061 (plasmid) [Persephonella marina EX-H1]|uniref:Uncharacterized protein n=1 Tax=Persephonella marina (strain DSM 14350 / EX-H1) TaxID=123214 RepID=C0QUZ0_PERMH|nr:hypothetical protein [Persephonella marina]ACO05002.1 hypothetical protein PERMA_A0061 [Persephonella marina EX-H1]